MLHRFAIPLMAVPSLALAQTQTTDCTRDYFGNVHCTTQQQQGINWGLLNQAPAAQPNAGQSFMNGYQRGQQIRSQIEQERAARAQQQAADQEAANEAATAQAANVAEEQMKHAAELIKGGDCAGALQYALDAGNLPLASQVKDYCAK